MQSVGVLSQLPGNIVKETLGKPTVFLDESPLSLEYVPARLHHRDSQLVLLTQLFRFNLEKPGAASQRVLITGDVGTGKTALAQRFGLDITKAAKSRRVKLEYVHVNCRECKGSLFLIMKRVMSKILPEFPRRGFSPEEILGSLIDLLDNRKTQLILALDELESLIRNEESAPIYNLTRIQEERVGKPVWLSMIFVLRDPEYLSKLDASTLSTLQKNFIKLDKYSSQQLETIIDDRIELAFKEDCVSSDVRSFIADLAAPKGDARYVIELLWRAGKYADVDGAGRVSLEHVRKAVGSVYPTFRGDYVQALSIHEKLLLLALSRILKEDAYATMGSAEREYKVACEEYGEEPRQHTQIWKYTKGLSEIGIISTKISGEGLRGKTTLLGLEAVPATTMRANLEVAMEALRKTAARRKFS